LNETIVTPLWKWKGNYWTERGLWFY